MDEIERIEHEYRGITYISADGFKIWEHESGDGARLEVTKDGLAVFSGPICNWLIFYKIPGRLHSPAISQSEIGA